MAVAVSRRVRCHRSSWHDPKLTSCMPLASGCIGSPQRCANKAWNRCGTRLLCVANASIRVDDTVKPSTVNHNLLIYMALLGPRHSHSIVNSRSRLRGKARCVMAEKTLDTDKSTVVFESPSQSSLLSISVIDGAPQRFEYESGIFCSAMTVSGALCERRRRYPRVD